MTDARPKSSFADFSKALEAAEAAEAASSDGAKGRRRTTEEIAKDNRASYDQLLALLEAEHVRVDVDPQDGTARVQTSACHGPRGVIAFRPGESARPPIQASCDKGCPAERVLGTLRALATAGGRRSVNVNSDAQQVLAAVSEAVVAWNDAESSARAESSGVLRHDLYRMGTEPYEQLATLHENGDGRLVTKAVSDPRASHLLARSCSFWRLVGGQDARTEGCFPTKEIRSGFLADLPQGIPMLDCVMAAPYLGLAGQIVTTPGYDVANRVYLDWSGTWERMRRREAVAVIDDYLSQFHTATPEDAVNLRAACLTPFIARYAGLCPMGLLVKPLNGAGSGATTAAFAIAGPVLRRAPKIKTLSHGSRDKESADKQVFSSFNSGESLVLFDNVSDLTGLNGLFAGLTGGEMDQRAFREQYDITVRMAGKFILATGNGLRPTAELARRCLTVTLDTGSATPSLVKTGADGKPYRYKGPQGMLAHAARNGQPRIVSAWLSLISDWIDSLNEGGPPGGSADVSGYELWGRVVSGIMEPAGMGTTMSDSEARVKEAAADDEQGAALELLLEWQGTDGPPWPAADAAAVLAPRGGEPRFPTKVRDPGSVAISRWLRTVASKGAVLLPDGREVRVVKGDGGSHRNSSVWHLHLLRSTEYTE